MLLVVPTLVIYAPPTAIARVPVREGGNKGLYCAIQMMIAKVDVSWMGHHVMATTTLAMTFARVALTMVSHASKTQPIAC